MNSKQEEQVPAHLSQAVLHAIQGALKEEKAPKAGRIVKIAAATLGSAAVLGIPFLLSFREQLNWTWGVAWALWSVCLLIGFTLHFYPQPRLMVPGVWSPFVLARILLIATVSTVLQILLCPSFVFLSSPLDWNPLFPVTNALMRLGGMNLCMLFCGFFFALISSLLSLSFVARVAKGRRLIASLPAFSILICSQLPVLTVQVMSEELRSYAGSWAGGLILGSVIGLFFSSQTMLTPVQCSRNR